ncbi:MAG: RNase adapter RapZ [Succinatimonas hippei]|nr:RNase adapter RapZ [Succinatimonas hippei]
MGMVQLFVISGRSGSGKTVALRVLEDLGFYCIDNLPIIFLSKLISMAKEHYPKLAVSIDIRTIMHSGERDQALVSELYRTARHDPEIRSTIVYLDASDEALVRRYSESRRLHPLSLRSLSLDEAISRESDMLMRISSVADLRIDTTNISIHELARQITVLVQGKPEKDLVIIFESFGFKDGIAMDADFVFDSRFLPNPFWNKELRNFTGLDKPVIDFFHNHPEVDHYIDMLYKLLSTWLKCIEKSNRSYLTVAIGCTGGRHRSVYIAQSLHDRFNKSGITAMVRHRTLIQEKNKA